MAKFSCFHLLIVMMTFGMSLAAESNAQELLSRPVSINITNLDVRTALNRIGKSADVKFSYEPTLFRNADRVSLTAEEEPLAKVLDRILNPLRLSYEVSGKYVVLTRQRMQSMLERRGGLIPFSVPLDLPVSGKVTDENGAELPGVNVVVKGTQRGTTTDSNGEYKLSVPDQKAVVVFSFVGYETTELVVGNMTKLDVSLRVNIKALGEVIVVGYGTQQRKDITGSLSSIKAEEIQKAVVPSVDQALQGRTPGLFVANSSGGTPGAAPRVRIRGSNSVNSGNEPLYVVDGLPIYPNNQSIRGSGEFRTDQLSPNTSNVLATINPNDIESIQVLKDASATAIYGARGANGVIVITTKRGSNRKSNLSLDYYSGVSTVTKKYPTLNAAQYATLVNQYNAAFKVAPKFTDQQIAEFQSTGGTDWQDQVLRNGFIHNLQLSSSGGTGTLQHYLSASYYDEQGILKGSGLNRFSLRANLDVTPTEKLKIGNSFTTSYTTENAIPNGSRDPFSGPGLLFSALDFPPTDPVRKDDGTYFLFPTRSSSAIANPVAIAETQEMVYNSLRSLGTVYLDYQILPGLTGRVNVGYDLLSRQERAYYPKATTLLGSEVGGMARITHAQDITWMTDFLLTYNKSFDKHKLNAVLGYTAQANTLERSLVGRSNFVTDAFGTTNLSGGSTAITPQSSRDKWSLLGVIGRLNYTLNDKYLFTFSGRYDGSSRFGANNKYAFFPSGAFGWRVSEERFMQDIKQVNDLKFRASYGIAGNQEIGLYRSLSRYVTVNEAFGPVTAVGVKPSTTGIPNPDLTWEQTSQLDLGVDLTAFANRLTFTFDYYRKTTNDLIFEFPVAVESGFASVLQNSGSVENRGIELSLGTNLKAGPIALSFDANFTRNNNKILDLGGRDSILVGESGAYIIGQDISSKYSLEFLGLWQLGEESSAAEFKRVPGDTRYTDVNRDGTYSVSGDRKVIGVSQPTYFYGLNTTANYKSFELSIFFQGSGGNIIGGGTRMGSFKGLSNGFVSAQDYWSPTNPSNMVLPFNSKDPLLSAASSRYFESANYLRLRNVMLAYNLPANALKKIGLRKLKVYLSGQNILTFTRYSGQDPEIIDQTDGIYPFARNYRFGLNIGF